MGKRQRARMRALALATAPVREDWFRIVNKTGSREATVYLYDEIGFFGTSASDFAAELAALDVDTINLRINSPGGEVFDGIAIHSTLKAHKATVNVVVDGLAASAASFIAMAGDTRTMTRHSNLMIHDASTLAWGDAAEMRRTADLLDRLSGTIANIYTQRCGKDPGYWRDLMTAETWFNAEEAVEYGLADQVEGDGPADGDPTVKNTWDLSVYRYAGRSQAPAPATAVDTRGRVVDGPCPTHHTGTSGGTWDKSTHEKRLPSPMPVATAKAMYGWYDSGRVEDGMIVKDACSLPHHEVSTDGTPGPANLNGVRNALARLSQTDMPDADRDAVRRHLQAHLDDADNTSDLLPVDYDPAQRRDDNGKWSDGFPSAILATALDTAKGRIGMSRGGDGTTTLHVGDGTITLTPDEFAEVADWPHNARDLKRYYLYDVERNGKTAFALARSGDDEWELGIASGDDDFAHSIDLTGADLDRLGDTLIQIDGAQRVAVDGGRMDMWPAGNGLAGLRVRGSDENRSVTEVMVAGREFGELHAAVRDLHDYGSNRADMPNPDPEDEDAATVDETTADTTRTVGHLTVALDDGNAITITPADQSWRVRLAADLQPAWVDAATRTSEALDLLGADAFNRAIRAMTCTRIHPQPRLRAGAESNPWADMVAHLITESATAADPLARLREAYQ